jgi:hypothetical protein
VQAGPVDSHKPLRTVTVTVVAGSIPTKHPYEKTASIILFTGNHARNLYLYTESASNNNRGFLRPYGGIMQTLLIVAVIVIALAVITQAGVLLAMYLLSRRVTEKVEGLIDESEKLMAPMESITNNLKIVSNDLAQTGELAREQILHIQGIITETGDSIRTQLTDVRERVQDAVDEARKTVMQPIRQYSAIATAIAEGIRTFFSGKKEEIQILEVETREQHPAA